MESAKKIGTVKPADHNTWAYYKPSAVAGMGYSSRWEACRIAILDVYPNAGLLPDASGMPSADYCIARPATKEDWPENGLVPMGPYVSGNPWEACYDKIKSEEAASQPKNNTFRQDVLDKIDGIFTAYSYAGEDSYQKLLHLEADFLAAQREREMLREQLKIAKSTYDLNLRTEKWNHQQELRDQENRLNGLRQSVKDILTERVKELELEVNRQYRKACALRLEELQEVAWKRVSDGLPPEGEVVLTIEGGSVTQNFITFSNAVPEAYRGRWYSGHPFVTHWQSLPKPIFVQQGICKWCDDGIIYNGSKGQVEHTETGLRQCHNVPKDVRYAEGDIEGNDFHAIPAKEKSDE